MSSGSLYADNEQNNNSSSHDDLNYDSNDSLDSPRPHNSFNNNQQRRDPVTESQAYRNNHTNEIIDDALMDSVRAAFLECVRTYYWTQVHKGIFKRYSYVTRTLVASVDLGLETTGTPGLQDWDYIAKVIKKSTAILDNGFINNAYSFLQMKLPRVAKHQQRKVENISNILTTFIAALKHAQIKIPHYFGPTSDIDTIEQAEVVRESQELVEQANERLRQLNDPLLEYRKTKEKLLQILSKLEAMLAQCKEEAVIMNSDLYHFVDSITEERAAINRLFSRKSTFKDSEESLSTKSVDGNDSSDSNHRLSLLTSHDTGDAIITADDDNSNDKFNNNQIIDNIDNNNDNGRKNHTTAVFKMPRRGLFYSFSTPTKNHHHARNNDGLTAADPLKQPLL